jgi:hypothetical protein
VDHHPQDLDGLDRVALGDQSAGGHGRGDVLGRRHQAGGVGQPGVQQALGGAVGAAHHQDPVVLRVVEAPSQIGMAAAADALPRIGDTGGGFGHGLLEVLGVALTDREDQVVAVREMQIDGRRGHAHRGGDGPDGEGGLVVGVDQDALGGGEDLVA